MNEAGLRAQIDTLLDLLEATGRELADEAAVIAEHGGDTNDLRLLMRKHGELGDAMVRAAKRTRERIS